MIFRLLPDEPTDEMLDAVEAYVNGTAEGFIPSPAELWRIMVAAAPVGIYCSKSLHAAADIFARQARKNTAGSEWLTDDGQVVAADGDHVPQDAVSPNNEAAKRVLMDRKNETMVRNLAGLWVAK